MNEGSRPKLIYFARRHPTLSAEAFTARWRAHGRLGMSLNRWRNVWRYAQCDRVQIPFEAPMLSCDGVASVTFRDEAARLAHSTSPEADVTRADEAQTFAGPVRTCALLTSEIEIAPHGAESAKLFVAVRRNPALTRGDFLDHWRTRAPELRDRLRAIDPQMGLSQNHAKEGSNPLALDCVDEISTSRLTEVMRAVTALTESDLRELIAEALLVPTREAVLHSASKPQRCRSPGQAEGQ